LIGWVGSVFGDATGELAVARGLKSVYLKAAGFDFPDCAFENREVASATFPVMFELHLNK